MLIKVLLKQNFRMEPMQKCELNPAGIAADSRDARQIAVRESQ